MSKIIKCDLVNNEQQKEVYYNDKIEVIIKVEKNNNGNNGYKYYYNDIELPTHKQGKNKEGVITYSVNLDKILKEYNINKGDYSNYNRYISCNKLNEGENNITIERGKNQSKKSSKNIDNLIIERMSEEDKKSLNEYENQITLYSNKISELKNKYKRLISQERVEKTFDVMFEGWSKEQKIEYLENLIKISQKEE